MTNIGLLVGPPYLVGNFGRPSNGGALGDDAPSRSFTEWLRLAGSPSPQEQVLASLPINRYAGSGWLPFWAPNGTALPLPLPLPL